MLRDEEAEKRAIVKTVLCELSVAYALNGDVWRSRAFRRACDIIDAVVPGEDNKGGKEKKASRRRWEYLVPLDAPQDVPGIGSSIGNVIRSLTRERHKKGGNLDEIIRMWRNSVVDESRLYAFQAFKKIMGVGDKMAIDLVNAGFLTIDQVREASLTTEGKRLGLQRAAVREGLRFYEYLDKRIPRNIATHVINRIQNLILSHSYGSVPVMPLGSYRRGYSSVGDIDILLRLSASSVSSASSSFSDSESVRRMLVRELGPDYVFTISKGSRRLSFLMRMPSAATPTSVSKNRSKMHSVGRVDVFMMKDASEEASFTLYATGSASFNEYMRQAAKRRGMRLNEYGLYNSLTGKRYDLRREEDAFRIIGIPYVPPELRT